MEFITTFFPPRRPAVSEQGSQSSATPKGSKVPQRVRRRTLKQFGAPLVDVVEVYNSALPPVMRDALLFIDTEEGLRQPYIFRKSPPMYRNREIQELANSAMKVEFENAIEAAAMIKLFLREMSEPIIPSSMYRQILSFNKIEGKEEKMLQAIHIVDSAPLCHKTLLWKLIVLLLKISQHAPVNFMDSNNLGAMVGPSLCWTTNSVYMKPDDMKELSSFATFLIENASQFFKYDPEYVPDGAWHSNIVNRENPTGKADDRAIIEQPSTSEQVTNHRIDTAGPSQS